MGRTAGAFHAPVVVRGGRRPPRGRAPAGPGWQGRWIAARPAPIGGCEMPGGAKAMQPEEVTRLVAERLNAGDAAGLAALSEPRAVLAYPADQPGGDPGHLPADGRCRGDVRRRDPAAHRPLRGPGADLNSLGRQHRRAGASAAPPARRLLAADHGPARGPAALAAAGTPPALRPRGQRVPARGKPRCRKVGRAHLGWVSSAARARRRPRLRGGPPVPGPAAIGFRELPTTIEGRTLRGSAARFPRGTGRRSDPCR
jgi:hypothetical protein